MILLFKFLLVDELSLDSVEILILLVFLLKNRPKINWSEISDDGEGRESVLVNDEQKNRKLNSQFNNNFWVEFF